MGQIDILQCNKNNNTCNGLYRIVFLCSTTCYAQFKGTLLKINPRTFLAGLKAYIIVTYLINCTFVNLGLRVQGTHFYGDAGEFDERRGINLVIWSQWLYHGTNDKLAFVVTVGSIVMGIMG